MPQFINTSTNPFRGPYDTWIESESVRTRLGEKGLSKRETEVLTWVARGKTNSEVGLILHISPRTVSKHLERIYCKLGVESRTAAVVQLLEIIRNNPMNQIMNKKNGEMHIDKKLVLLVDDDSVSSMAIRSLLESQGYLCQEVGHGTAALTWLETGHADLVITGNHIPKLGGIQFLERLSRRSNGASLPAIVYTNCMNEEMKKRALSAGAYAILRRPCNFGQFLAMVAQAIQFGIKPNMFQSYR